MPVVSATDGVKIHYEVDGEGPPILLIHGFGSGGERWRVAGYVDALAEGYRVISMDVRGHGRSGKPHDPGAYDDDSLASDAVAVLDDVAEPTAHVWGYSMGGRVTRTLYTLEPSRFRSAIFGGSVPHTPFDPDTDGTVRVLGNGIEAYVESLGIGPNDEVGSFYLRNDAEALLALRRAQVSGEGEAQPRIECPVLLYTGDVDERREPAAAWAASLPNASFFTVPGGHGQAFADSAAVVPRARAFLDGVEAAVPASTRRP